MARSSLWCLVALLLALLFVTANGLRGSATQVEGRESRTTPRSRGGSRFNLKASEDLEPSTTPFSSPSSGPSRTRNGRRGGSRTGEVSRSEATTLRSRLGHGRDITLSADNAQKSNGSPTVSSKFERRGPSSPSATRKSSTEIPPRDRIVDTATTTDVSKITKNERDGESQRAKETQKPGRIGLFRARNGVTARRGSTTTTTTEKVTQVEESGIAREFDTTGPSVFSGTTEIPRSRTGRKIQKTLSSGDLRSGLPASGRFTSARQNAQRRSGQEDETSPSFAASSRSQRRSDDFSAKRRHDIVPSGSETISIDIPLITETQARSRIYNSLSPPGTEDGTASSSSTRHGSSAGNGRARGRGRSTGDKNTETTTVSRSASRRGSSRFAEAAPLNNNSLEKTRSRSETTHTRSTEKRDERSRSRGRSQESTTNKSARSENASRNSEAKRNSGRRDRTVETSSTVPSSKSLDSEARGRSRAKPRAVGTSPSPTTTTVAPEETTVTIATAETVIASTVTLPSTTPSTTTIQQQTETTAEPRASRNRGRGATTTSTSTTVPKEDFFNHGLGFRGRKIATEAPKDSVKNQNTSKTEPARRGNPGWTLKRRPGHRPEDIETTTARPTATTESGAATISNEIPTGNETPETTTASLSEPPTKARGSKRPSPTDAEKPGRGNKSFKKTSPGLSKVNKDTEEGDNYPPEFKARLAQLKNGIQQATAKPSLGELYKKRPTTDPQYVARSRQKLDSAVKLVTKSETKADDRDQVEKIQTSSATTVGSIDKKKRPEVTRRSSKIVATTAKSIRERKPTKIAKRYGALKSLGSTEKPQEASSLERKLARFNNIRKVEEAIESTVASETEESNDLIDSTTLPYSKDRQVNRKKSATTTQTSRSRILSRRAKELPRETVSSTTRKSRVPWFAPHLDKNHQEPTPRTRKNPESPTRRHSATSTTTKRSRVWNLAYIDRNWQEPTRKSASNDASSTTESSSSTTSRGIAEAEVTDAPPKITVSAQSTVSSVSRYARKKTEVFKPFESVPKIATTVEPAQPSRRREFRPRTATYRRHSELPPVVVVNALPAEKTPYGNSVAITPKTPAKFHASVRGSTSNATQRLARQEPTLNVKISTDNGTTSTNSSDASGIVGTSNGASGSSNTNIFNPTRSTFLLSSNETLLDQLRSTVAPLLSVLGNRTPIFSNAYSQVNNNSNSGTRVTPSGSPPRFSARYKGAELFVRRPNVLEPAGPFITSSTTPFTPTEVLTTTMATDEESEINTKSIVWTDDPDNTTGTFTPNVLGTNDLR